ncbi:MAG: response regulator [Acidobacteriota bacterium]
MNRTQEPAAHDHQPLILIVEDDLASRILLREVLTRWGYRCRLAEDGIQALEQLDAAHRDQDPVRLVVLDIQLPRLDGYGVLSSIRSNPRTQPLPVIAISAFATEEEQVKANAATFDGFIPKPVDMPRLRQEMTWLLERAAQPST